MKRKPTASINRRNWKDTREYLAHCADVRQCQPRTVDVYRCSLDALLEWATSTSLSDAPAVRPTLPQHLQTTGLSVAYLTKTLAIARAFFTWAVETYPDRYPLKPAYIQSLTSRQREGEVREPQAFTVEEIFALVEAPTVTLIEQRDRAAVAFLFLSGMRDSAFCSLPLKAVDFEAYPPRVKQWPSLGVRTKFGKAANTVLLVEPAPLLKIVREWDETARACLPDTALWFAQMDASGEDFTANQTPGTHRTFAKRLRLLCERAHVAPKSPHKLRNGHIVHALKLCRDMGDLKAVSQNVMHQSITTTEATYGRLKEDDIAARLTMLGATTALFEKPVSVEESSR